MSEYSWYLICLAGFVVVHYAIHFAIIRFYREQEKLLLEIIDRQAKLNVDSLDAYVRSIHQALSKVSYEAPSKVN